MSTKGTKVPAVKNVPAKTDPELRSMLDSVKEAVEVRLGRRGDPRDRAVTLRELIDSGLAEELKGSPFSPNGVPGIGIVPPKLPPGNLSVPPAPTGLEAAGAFTTIVVKWNQASYGNHAYTEVWRSRTDELGGATLLTTTNAFVLSDPVEYNSSFYYWVRFVSTSDITGPFNNTNGVKAETEIDIGAVMDSLSEELKNLPGFSTLNNDFTVSLDGVTRTLQATLEALDAATATAVTNVNNLTTNTPRVFRSNSEPTQRADSTSLQTGDIWIDTDSSPNVNEMFVYTGASFAATTAGSTSSSDTTLQTQITSNGNAINQNASNVLLVAGVSDVADISTSINITTLNASITNGTTGLAANASAISTLNGTVVSQGGSISTQSGQITALQNTLTGFNGSNTIASAVQGLQTQITANDGELGAKASAASVTALTTVVEAKAKTFVQNEPPTSIAIGDLWIDSNAKNKLYRAATAGADEVAANEWVAINDQSGITIFAQDAEPTGLNVGDLWFDTNEDKKQYRFDGTNWQPVDDARIASSATAVSNLSTAVGLNGSNSTKITTLENALSGYSGSGAVSSAITALTQNITNNDGDITSINNSITSLTNTVTVKTQTFVGNSTPTALAVGDLWVKPSEKNKLYRATAAGNSNWVAVNDTSGITIFTQASEPTGLNAGDIWFDTDDANKQHVFDGTNWAGYEDTRVAANASAVTNLSTAVGLTGSSSSKITNLEATVNHAQTGVAATASAVTLLSSTVSSIPVNFNQADAPASGSSTLGDLWIDTDDNRLYRFDGSSWQPKRDSTLTAASTAISSLQTNVAGNTADISSNSTAISNESSARANAISQVSASIGTKNQTFVGNSTPTAITIGDLWVKPSENNQLYRATATGTGGWSSIRDGNIASVQSTAATAIANAATAQGTADGKVTTFFQSGIPGTSVKEGDLWIDSDDNKLYRASSDGSDEIKAGEWVAVQDEAIATAILDAATAQSTADGKIVTFYETDEPTATSVGDLWIDTDDNKLYRATGTGTGNWVSVRDTAIASAQSTAATAITNAAAAQGTADGKVTTFFQNGIPTSGVGVGDLWIDTDDNKLYRAASDGSNQIVAGEWVEVQDKAIATAITNAATAQSTADGKIVTFYEANAPSATSVGDLWVDTDDNELYRATGTGTGNWVSVRDTTNDNHPRIFTETSAPTAINVGDLWFDTDDNNKQYRWNGSIWALVRDVTTSAEVTAVSDAVVDLEGNAAASYVLQVNANGAVAGMVIEANASDSGTGTAIQFQADKFAIWSGSGASASNSTAPFIVTAATTLNGETVPAGVYMANAFIQNGSIISAKIGTLSADKITFGTMHGDRIEVGSLNANRIDANIIVATDLSNNSSTTIHGGNIITGTLAATAISANTITGTQINADTLNVKHFDNVSADIKSHRADGAFVPLSVEASTQVWPSTQPGRLGGQYNVESAAINNPSVTTANVRNNAKYRVVVSSVYGNVTNGTIQYSFNNSTWVSLNPKMNALAGNYRTYVFIWDGQITGLSSTQSTVYWRINWNVSGGQVNTTYQSLYVSIDNTQ